MSPAKAASSTGSANTPVGTPGTNPEHDRPFVVFYADDVIGYDQATAMAMEPIPVPRRQTVTV